MKAVLWHLLLLVYVGATGSNTDSHGSSTDSHGTEQSHAAPVYIGGHSSSDHAATNHHSGHDSSSGHGSSSQYCSGQGSSSGHGEHHAHDHETLVGLFAAVVLGSAILHLSTHPWFHNLQFTVVLFVVGVIGGIVLETLDSNKGLIIVRTYDAWKGIDPHLLLFTFLPPLLAGDAMTIDTHVARRCATQCMILAGPGVIVGAFSTAIVLNNFLPWGWDFMTCLTVGSILAATDPVAVVGLLKELGAPQQLTIMIQGESLLNDGIAIVLFTVAYEIVGGEEYGWGRIFVSFLKSTVGAGSLGIAIGMGFYLWIFKASDRLAHSSPIIQIILTLACAYWSFIFAEGVCHISGVLSTVCASLVLAHKMWPVLVDRRSMLEIWHVLETIGNTLVFFLAGVLTGKAMLAIPLADYVWVLVVYVAITIIRLVMLMMFLPFLNMAGGKVTAKDVAIMTWGGLRGMVGLALAILVKKEGANGAISEIDGDRILFLVGSIAALTLVVNATTCPALTEKLEITMAPEGRNVLIRNVDKVAREHVEFLMWEDMGNMKESKTYLPAVVRELMQNFFSNIQHHLPGHHDHHENHGDHHEINVLPASHGTSKVNNDDMQRRNIFNLLFQERTGRAADPEQLMYDFQKWKCRMLKAAGKHGEINKFQFGAQLPRMQQMFKQQVIDPKQLKIVREVFLESVRASYWEQLERGRFIVGSEEPTLLLDSINLAKESCATHLSDWEFLERDIAFEQYDPPHPSKKKTEQKTVKPVEEPTVAEEPVTPKDPKAAAKEAIKQQARSFGSFTGTVGFRTKRAATAHDIGADLPSFSHSDSVKSTDSRKKSHSLLSLKGLAKWAQEKRIQKNLQQQTTAIQVITAFVEAHREAQKQIVAYFGVNADTSIVSNCEEAYCIMESQIEVFKACTMSGSIDRNVHLRVNTMWKARNLAEEFRKYVENVAESGVLQAKEAEVLLHPIADTMRGWENERRRIFRKVADVNKKGQPLSEVQAALIVQRCFRRWKGGSPPSSPKGSQGAPKRSPSRKHSRSHSKVSLTLSEVSPQVTFKKKEKFNSNVSGGSGNVETESAREARLRSERQALWSTPSNGESTAQSSMQCPDTHMPPEFSKVEKPYLETAEGDQKVEKPLPPGSPERTLVPVEGSPSSPLMQQVDNMSEKLQYIEDQKKQITEKFEMWKKQQMEEVATNCEKDLAEQLDIVKNLAQQIEATKKETEKMSQSSIETYSRPAQRSHPSNDASKSSAASHPVADGDDRLLC